MNKILWQPSAEAVSQCQMKHFIDRVNEKEGLDIKNYRQLHRWSVENIAGFWANFFDFARLKFSEGYEQVIDDPGKMPGARWFSGLKMNFAENLLWRNDNHEAIVFFSESERKRSLTYKQLNQQVKSLACFLKQRGIVAGDRVAAFMPNMPEAVVTMLAATSQGAVYSSASPDFGHKGVIDRFGQIQPRVLVTSDCYYYKGKRIDLVERVNELVNAMPSIELVLVATMNETGEPAIERINKAVSFQEAFAFSNDTFSFIQAGFDHPIYIMFSSGTTGLPKCMVQGPGVLLNHLKEHRLHGNLDEYKTIFYFTTTGWMMWNWLVSALGVGARLVLYDGNPFYPGPMSLFKLVDDEKIQTFGTSAKYLDALADQGCQPGEEFDLSSLEAILSTGSPLNSDSFDYVYENIKKDLRLSSISGGTDLNGCFALGNPMLPVKRGELQCLGLGMNVKIYDDNGTPVLNKEGELVCESAFPSMPLYFYNDQDGSRYQAAYFEKYPGVWRHGDFALVTEEGTMVIHGRSDATLNPQGVRIGTAEIYRVVEGMAEIADSVVVGQSWQKDVRVILFVKLENSFLLDEGLEQKIKNTIRESVSPRHVPAKVIAVDDIPYTKNMKKVEIAVKNLVNGREVTNIESLANPESLNLYKDLPELQT